RVLRDRASWGDVVSGDRVGEHDQCARVLDVAQRGWLAAHALEIWRLLHGRRGWGPSEQIAPLGGRKGPPRRGALKDLRVLLAELIRPDGPLHGVSNLGLRRPQVTQVNRVAVWVDANRFDGEIDVHRTREGEGDHQRRRREIRRADLGMDARLEI